MLLLSALSRSPLWSVVEQLTQEEDRTEIQRVLISRFDARVVQLQVRRIYNLRFREPDEAMPEKRDALAALQAFGDGLGGLSGTAGTDALFWSWWPRGDDGDATLVRECMRRGLPVVFVGEPRGGITGSDAIWEARPPPRRLSGWAGAPLEGVDVPRWPGMRDCTWVVQAHATEQDAIQHDEVS